MIEEVANSSISPTPTRYQTAANHDSATMTITVAIQMAGSPVLSM